MARCRNSFNPQFVAGLVGAFPARPRTKREHPIPCARRTARAPRRARRKLLQTQMFLQMSHNETPSHLCRRILISRPDFRVRPPLGSPLSVWAYTLATAFARRLGFPPAQAIAESALALPVRVVRARDRIYQVRRVVARKSVARSLFDSPRPPHGWMQFCGATSG